MSGTLNVHARRQAILSKLSRQQYLDVNSLAEEFSVTVVTIRNDFDNLEQRGLLVRTHGGAILPEDQSIARRFSTTINENRERKEKIARLAKTLVVPGSTIIIDAGSTGAILAHELKGLELTVITNSIPVIHELQDETSIEVIVVGGVLRRSGLSMIGSFSRSILQSVNADLYFMGSTAFDSRKGVSCPNIMESQTKQFMMEATDKVCVIADSTKIDQVALATVCGWDEIDYFVTDELPPAYRELLENQHHVKVFLPEK